MPGETESPMKMMSWSRYHNLSWSLLRARRRHRGMKRRGVVRHRRHVVVGTRGLFRLLQIVSRTGVSNS
jgi:hypothetical protein